MLTSLFVLIVFADKFSINWTQQVDNVIDISHLGANLFGKPIETNKQLSVNGGENPEERGSYLEGDLLHPSSTKNGMKAEAYRWKDGIVPYEIRGSYTAHDMAMIERALNEYHKNTCISFIPRRSPDRDFISIESGNSGCWSSVGRIGGKQVVNLQTPGCVRKIGTVIHELAHALGFLHEQNREERDKFVIIKTNNIKDGYEVNFSKAKPGETTGFGVTYDYGSVLHYSANAFSKNGQPTIQAKMKSNEKMGQREGFSKKDIEKINKMYKCQRPIGSAQTTPKPNSALTTTTSKPSQSVFGSLIESLFPSSSMDEEETVIE